MDYILFVTLMAFAIWIMRRVSRTERKCLIKERDCKATEKSIPEMFISIENKLDQLASAQNKLSDKDKDNIHK